MAAPKYPAIPEPVATLESLRDTLLAVKQVLEILTGQRGTGGDAVITNDTLPPPPEIPPAYPPTGGTLTGDVIISKSEPRLVLDKAASGEYNAVEGQKAGTTRWFMSLGNADIETGTGNSGSNFGLHRYTDAGVHAGEVLSINRASGDTTFANNLLTSGEFHAMKGEVKVYGLSGDTGQGVVRFNLAGDRYIHYDKTSYVFAGAPIYAVGATFTGNVGINGTATFTSLTSAFLSRSPGLSATNMNTSFQNTLPGTKSYGADAANEANSPANGWWFHENYRHSNNTNYWGVQVAWGWEDHPNELWTRNVSGGTFGAWVKYLNSSNYSAYALPITGGTMSGQITSATSGVLINSAGGMGTLEIKGAGHDGTYYHSGMSFHIPGVFATNFGIKHDGNFWMGGWSHGGNLWKFWTTRDIGNIVGSVRLFLAADVTNPSWSEPYPGAVVTALGQNGPGSFSYRYRYLQIYLASTSSYVTVGFT